MVCPFSGGFSARGHKKLNIPTHSVPSQGTGLCSDEFKYAWVTHLNWNQTSDGPGLVPQPQSEGQVPPHKQSIHVSNSHRKTTSGSTSQLSMVTGRTGSSPTVTLLPNCRCNTHPTMEYYSALKSSEILVHAPTQASFENILLIERSQA